MLLSSLLPLCVAAMSWLGTLLLGMGEQNYLFAVSGIVVVIASLVLVDWLRLVRLPQTAANVAALGALAFCAIETWQRWGSESQLLAVANLMVYLQFILLFQEKNQARYWLLILISALQVAVASALSLDMYFGGLLLIYLGVSLFTLILFLFYREAPDAAPPVAPPPPPHEASRWPLLDVETVFTPRAPGDPLPELRSFAFAAQWLRMVGATLTLAVCVFLFVPRIGRPGWRPYTTTAASTTGFAEGVTLGELGPIIENSEEVLRVQFLDADTGYPYPLEHDPLLRGSVLPLYDSGRWAQRASTRQALSELSAVLPLKGGDEVLQRMVIEPLDTEVLFCAYPVANIREDPNIQFDAIRRCILRHDRHDRQELNRTQFSCDLMTGAFRGGVQLPITAENDFDSDISQLRQVPDNLREKLRTLSEQIVAGIDIRDRVARARAIESYLRDSNRFEYSLAPSPAPRGVDPVEHFLFSSRRGHCEYFASAAALLMRSIEIPTRLVLGYNGGDWNDLGRFYQVRQLHTHAWVEVYLGARHLPPELKGARLGWLRIDPTPPRAAPVELQPAGWRFPSLGQVREYSQFIWSNYVLGMNARRQSEAIYTPIGEAAKLVAGRLFNPAHWPRSFKEFRDWLQVGFHWRAGLLAAIACFLLVAGYRAVRGAWRFALPRWRSFRRRRALARGGASRIDFYRRLQEMLARRGWRRRGNQTPREFADEVAAALDPAQREAAAPAIELVTNAYYQVRFGPEALDAQEAASIARALESLAAALGTPPTRRVSS